MVSNIESEFSLKIEAFEKDKLGLDSIEERVEDRLNALSLQSYKEFINDPKGKNQYGNAKSSKRKQHVLNLMKEIQTNVKYNIEKEFNTHKSMYYQYWRIGNPNITIDQLDECYRIMVDAQSFFIWKKILSAYLSGDTGDTEKSLYEYIVEKMKYIIWDIVSANFRYFLCLLVPNELKNNNEITKSPFVGKMQLPEVLSKPLSLSSIEKYNDCDPKMHPTCDLICSILQPIMIPVTIPDLRSVRVWRGNSVRIMNYVISVVLYGRYIYHPDFPPALKKITETGPVFPPPWWVVVNFFKSCGLPDNKPTKNQESETISMKKELCEAMQQCYVDMHVQSLSYMFNLWDRLEVQRRVLSKKESSVASESSYKLIPFNCTVTSNTKRPPLFNDLTDWVYRHRRQIQIGVYDEFIFTKGESVDPNEVEYLKSIAESGCHYNEKAIMEIVLNSDIQNNPKPPK